MNRFVPLLLLNCICIMTASHAIAEQAHQYYEIRSYKQLPVSYYQIQTKFRDEIRPRFGIMRAREFLMKDAYSFHASQACLEQTYQLMHRTYSRIFTRLGLDFRPVIADTGSENAVVTTMQPTMDELRRVWFSEENFERRKRAGELAQKYGVSMINIALAYVLRQDFPTFPLIGPRVLAETASCIESLDIALTTRELAYLDLH